MTSPLDPKTIEECARVAEQQNSAYRDDRMNDAWASAREEIAAAIRALPSSPPGWRDIASAPRDGTVILGWSENEDFPAAMCWEHPKGDDGSHRRWPNEWTYADWMLSNQAGPVTPTHWQPLPAPPAAAGTTKG